MTLWFGEAWPTPENPAPVCDPMAHMATPVGDTCASCHGRIKEGDQGVYIPMLGEMTVWADTTGHPWHLGCFLDSLGVPHP